MIFNIQKFCVNDGPGIRTTVFMKGCPLNCLWCHNPESKQCRPELLYDRHRCVLCGRCQAVCPEGSHEVLSDRHIFDRVRCTVCGKCADVCPSGALEVAGYTATVDDVMKKVLRDQPFYDRSGGGLTLSGGEPLHQYEFAAELLASAKCEGLHTCVETCGFAPSERILEISEYTALFLYDWKETDPERHRLFTGADNDLIRRNLLLLDERGADIILRCPIIPGYNDRPEHFKGIADLAEQLDHVRRVEIEPYHPLGRDKSEALGRDYPPGALAFPDESLVREWIEYTASMTGTEVRRG